MKMETKAESQMQPLPCDRIDEYEREEQWQEKRMAVLRYPRIQ